MTKRQIYDGQAFEDWLAIIATQLPAHVVAKINLGELRQWYDLGMELDQVIEKIQPPKPVAQLTPTQQVKFNSIKAKLKAKQEVMRAL